MRGVARSAGARERIVRACRRSGLSTREFAASSGVAASTLYQWLAAARATPIVRLARVVRRPVASEPGAAAMLVLEIDDARLRVPAGFDRATLASVLELLATRGGETS